MGSVPLDGVVAAWMGNGKSPWQFGWKEPPIVTPLIGSFEESLTNCTETD
jgi:hypothetical protein